MIVRITSWKAGLDFYIDSLRFRRGFMTRQCELEMATRLQREHIPSRRGNRMRGPSPKTHLELGVHRLGGIEAGILDKTT